MMETTTKPKNTKKGIIIFLSVCVFILFGLNLYYAYTLYEQKEHLKEELSLSKESFEEISIELQTKIKEIEDLGGDVSELKAAQDEILQEKEDLQKRSNYTWQQLKEARKVIKGHKQLLKQKEKEIVQLKEANESLLAENVELKEDKNELSNSISSLSKEKSQLEEKVALASKLKIKSIDFVAVNKRGKERKGSEWRKRHVSKIKIDVAVDKNEIAQVSSKELLLQVVDPSSKVIFDVAKGSGTFMMNGKEFFYTLKKDFIYDRSEQKISFLFENFTDFKSGKYLVKIFSEEQVVGETNFVIK